MFGSNALSPVWQYVVASFLRLQRFSHKTGAFSMSSDRRDFFGQTVSVAAGSWRPRLSTFMAQRAASDAAAARQRPHGPLRLEVPNY